MKNPDEMVERVLAGLREVEAPVGLERRVLAAMEERTSQRVGWSSPMRWAVACAVVAVGAAGLVMMRPGRVPAAKSAVAVVPAVQSVRVERVQGRNTGIRTVTASPTGPHSLSPQAAFRSAQNDLKAGNGLRGGDGVGRRVVEDKVVAGVDAGGFPAPPMALTESERLLLRVAHRVDATELTPLNAEARERQSAAFDAEFLEFFTVPDVPEDETGSPENAKGETR